MLNISTVTEYVTDLLDQDLELRGYTVTRSTPVNADPRIAAKGWIGVYKESVEYTARTLGQNTGRYDALLSLRVIVQRQNPRQPEKTEEMLEDSIQKIINAVLASDKAVIHHISDFSVEYGAVLGDRNEFYFQQGIISFTCNLAAQP